MVGDDDDVLALCGGYIRLPVSDEKEAERERFASLTMMLVRVRARHYYPYL